MAKIKGAEPICEAAVAKLKAGMRARVDTINGDYDDGIAIKPPATDTTGGNQLDGSDYYTAFKTSIPFTPSIIVAEGPTTPDPQNEAVHEILTDTKIAVYILEGDADPLRLGKKLQRQARAVWEVLWDDPPQEKLGLVAPFDGQEVFRLEFEGTRPGRAFEPEQIDGYQQFYLIVFNAKQVEPGP
jgi:hypothetical protein